MRKIEKPSNIYLALLKIADKLNNVSIFSDQKNYICRVSRPTAQSVASSSFVKVLFNTKVFDPESLFDLTNSKFIAPVSGFYQVNAHLGLSVMTGNAYIMLYKNGVIYSNGNHIYGAVSSPVRIILSDLIYLEKGDYLEIYTVQTNSGAVNTLVETSSTFLSISKVNSYISPTPTQTNAKCRVWLNTLQADLPNLTYTKVLFDSKSYDPNNCFDLTNRRFIAPESGFYQINTSVYFANCVADKTYSSAIYKNGVAVSYCHFTFSNTAELVCLPKNCDVIQLNKGDYIEIFARSISGTNTVDISNGETNTYLSIHKLSD